MPPVAQARARHVRKRSEGSGFDTASRWTDISREEKGKWLIQEYGKVRCAGHGWVVLVCRVKLFVLWCASCLVLSPPEGLMKPVGTKGSNSLATGSVLVRLCPGRL